MCGLGTTYLRATWSPSPSWACGFCPFNKPFRWLTLRTDIWALLPCFLSLSGVGSALINVRMGRKGLFLNCTSVLLHSPNFSSHKSPKWISQNWLSIQAWSFSRENTCTDRSSQLTRALSSHSEGAGGGCIPFWAEPPFSVDKSHLLPQVHCPELIWTASLTVTKSK